jgi:uncharacterized membrane protein
MEWFVVGCALALVFVIVVAWVVFLELCRRRLEPPVATKADDYLTEYFALDEFNDEELRERIEHLRGVPELR